MASESIWRGDSRPAFSPLREDLEVDVVIIGAGLTGLLTARALQRAGKSVVILERRRVASGTTGSSTAHLTALIDCGYAALERKFGIEGAQRVAVSLTAAIDEITALADDLKLTTCERLPCYLYAHSAQAVEQLADEIEAARRAGLAVEPVGEVPLPSAEHGGLMLARQAQLDPVELASALAADIVSKGGRLYEDSRVVYVEEGEPCRVETTMATVRAANIVMATHTPIGVSVLQTEVAPYRSYVVAVRSEWPIGRALYFDTAEPYNYVRLASSSDPSLLLVGGADHKTGDATASDAWTKVESWARFQMNAGTPRARWSAQLYVSADGLPYIGRTSRHGPVHVATGYGGDGIPFSAVAARVIAASVLGEHSTDLELYSPNRIKPIASARKFIRENADVARHFVGDRLTPGDERNLDAVKRGEGRLVQLGMRKVAAYRDPTGSLHVLRPVCAHLKCIVHWNSAELSWDCPCHGARYDVDGKPLEGPSLANLEPYELPQPIDREPEAVTDLPTNIQPAT